MPQRIRRTKKTRLIYCEGAHDKAFLSAMKSVYATDEYNTDIKSGAGGDQVHLVEEAIRMGDGYGEVFIQLDNDRAAAEMAEAQQLALDNGITVLRTTPFMEKLLIAIVEPAKNTNGWSVTRSKNYFQQNYIQVDKRTDARAYKPHFTLAKFEAARSTNTELDEIIKAFQ